MVGIAGFAPRYDFYDRKPSFVFSVLLMFGHMDVSFFLMAVVANLLL